MKKRENRTNRELFEDSPIPLWEEDFSEVKKFIDRLRDSGIKNFREYFKKNPKAVAKCATMVKIIKVNKATLKLYKAKSKKDFRDGISAILTKDSCNAFIDELVAIAEGKTRFECETVTQTLKGDKRHIILRWVVAPDCEKTLSRVIVSKLDITKQKESEEKYKNLFENARETIILCDLKGNITSVNKTVQEYGLRKDEIIGKNLLKFVPKKHWSKVRNDLAKIARGELVEGEIEVITRKGKKIAEYRSNPIREGNKIVGLQTILRDITERKQFEERLSALNKYSQSLNSAKSMEEIYKLTLDAAEKILGFEFADILMIRGKTLSLMAHRGPSKIHTLNLPLDGKRGVTVKAARMGKYVYIPDTNKEKAYVETGVKGLSELAVPIKVGTKVLGVLNVESERISAFNEEDMRLLEILAAHTAIAITNIRRRDQLRNLSKRLAYLLKSVAKIMRVKDNHQRLKVIADAIRNFGWRRVVISLRDESLEGTDLVTAGLTKEEIKLLMERKAPGHVWRERLGPKFERFKIGEFYYLPWNDPWIRENVHGVPANIPLEEATTYAGVPSRLSPEEMADWHPQDMLYAPLRTPGGRIVGILSMDDPVDGRKPTRETLAPLELFLHQAAIAIENAQLIDDLKKARKQLEAYADELELKVEERTRELKKSQEQLLKAQRLAVIGELAGMVGHDLRNPLTSIAGATYYLKRKLDSKMSVEVREMLELIEKNIAYSNKIISDLLDYSREIELELSETTLKTLVKEALSLVKMPGNVQVINLVKNKPKIKCDVEKMKRTFVNLIKNAVEAMPKGGKLTIRSRKVGDNVEIAFTDTGVGMLKETLKKLWVPLFTTKAKGMGFGLPICKRFIEAHSGCISCESTVGKGTTFKVTLPIKPKKLGGEKVWVKMPESSLLTTTKT